MEEEKQSFFKRRKKEIILTIIALVIVMGITFAWLLQTINSNNENVVVAGHLRLTILNEDPIIKAGGEDGYAMPMADSYGLETKPYTFTVQNTGEVAANYEITLIDASSYNETTSSGYGSGSYVERQITSSSQRIPDNKIKYNLREGSDTNTNAALLSSTANRILVSGTIAPGATKTYQLRLWIDSSAETSDIDDKTFAANLSINAIQQNAGAAKNSHIKAVYKYNENGEGTGAAFTGCLGGAEAGCTDISSQATKLTNYSVGTIIKYEVKSGTELYFNVIHDDGDTLTIQQRENTVSGKAWYGTSSDYTNENGPALTSGYVLYELEQVTNSWTNVNDQTYSIGNGSTTLGYSGCSAYNNCSTATYTLSRTAKARMITIQETNRLGCTSANMSCPKFVNNYLANSTGYGGTFAAGNGYYWTMSANSSDSTNAWDVNYGGKVFKSNTYNTSHGARAVVVIDK